MWWKLLLSLPLLIFLCAHLTSLCSNYSMTELEKDIGNLRSGLKSVESVSHKQSRANVLLYDSFVCDILPRYSSLILLGAWLPEAAATRAGRQVCVRGEPVYHSGQLQLLGCGGLTDGGQRTGESLYTRVVVFADRKLHYHRRSVPYFLSAHLLRYGLTWVVAFLGKLTAWVIWLPPPGLKGFWSAMCAGLK